MTFVCDACAWSCESFRRQQTAAVDLRPSSTDELGHYTFATMRMVTTGSAILLAVCAGVAIAQDAATPLTAAPVVAPLTLGKLFTFLLVALGPFNVVGPFVEMTRGRDASFRRRLALHGTLIAAVALLIAATLGAKTLRDWNVSSAALFITTGVLLFGVGMQFVVAQYKPRKSQENAPVDSASSVSALAFSPLAFPSIVTPYGIAVLALAMTLAPDFRGTLQVLAVAAVILTADLVAMLAAERLLHAPLVAATFGIVGSVMAVLQIALSVQAVIVGLRLLGIVGPHGT
jgi:multiple antibiotic resistance protein